MALKNFRRGETTYICQVCKKNTRNVGGDEAGCRLCLDCFNLAGIENGLSDNGMEYFQDYAKEVAEIFIRRPELAPLHEKLSEALKTASV